MEIVGWEILMKYKNTSNRIKMKFNKVFNNKHWVNMMNYLKHMNLIFLKMHN